MSKRASLAPLAGILAVVWASPAAALERHITLSPGESLRIVVEGEGTPVVLLPGLLGSAFGFRKLVGPLVAGGHRAVVIEPLGIGGSAKPEAADYSLTAQADRISAVMVALGLDEAVVVAHSVSASMAFRLAARHPERVKAIVSLDGGPTETAATPGFRRAMRFAFLIKLFGGTKRIERIVRSTLEQRSADPRWVTDDVVAGYMSAGARDLDGTLTALRQIARAREPEPLRPRLCQVLCPVRLVIGTVAHEGGIGASEIALLQDRLPHFSIDRVEAAGHFVFEEKPEAVVAAIESAARAPAAPRLADGSRP
ncbi:MAG TPA: alpha/beta hydrolase [Vicinamibacteria bacterium]|nr:alpha/beta hydrolase [Vicinamibacteria bacterium]